MHVLLARKRGKMEQQWRPLLDLFSSTSPNPHSHASPFLSHHHLNPSSFLTLLLSPTSSGSIRIQTLPAWVQSRILSFLAVEASRFPAEQLRSLAGKVLGCGSRPREIDFWVRRSALQLLGSVSHGARLGLSPDWDGMGGVRSLPPCLGHSILLPWLPIETGQPVMAVEALDLLQDDPPATPDVSSPAGGTDAMVVSEQDSAMDPETQAKAAALKARFAAAAAAGDDDDDSTTVAGEIHRLCSASNSNSFEILTLIEPWQATDELVAVLLPPLSAMAAQALSATVLPKFLTLHTPPSRLLLTVTIDFCKTNPAAAVEGLLLPLSLSEEGINTLLCDILTKIIRECLHPVHASAFFQRLLCKEEGRRLTCLPCHRSLLSEDLVWTEACFALLQNMLDQNVFLTPDSVERIVVGIGEMACRLSRSLKFGNFLLCLVGKYGLVLKLHKDSLVRAVEGTDTFLTKSILAKLSDL